MRGRLLRVAGGGRYDLTYRQPDGPVRLTVVGDANASADGQGFEGCGQGGAYGTGRTETASLQLAPNPSAAGRVPAVSGPLFDPLHYGSAAGAGPLGRSPRFDRDFSLVLGNSLGFHDGSPMVLWTVNNAVHPDIPALVVEEGDLVRTTFLNRSLDDHPMHLHGHRMLVLSRDGEPATGSPWWTDTLNVAPGERYEVAFRSDNPGLWMDHCHNLDHARDGMVLHLAYDGVTGPYESRSSTGNVRSDPAPEGPAAPLRAQPRTERAEAEPVRPGPLRPGRQRGRHRAAPGAHRRMAPGQNREAVRGPGLDQQPVVVAQHPVQRLPEQHRGRRLGRPEGGGQRLPFAQRPGGVGGVEKGAGSGERHAGDEGGPAGDERRQRGAVVRGAGGEPPERPAVRGEPLLDRAQRRLGAGQHRVPGAVDRAHDHTRPQVSRHLVPRRRHRGHAAYRGRALLLHPVPQQPHGVLQPEHPRERRGGELPHAVPHVRRGPHPQLSTSRPTA